MTDNSWGKILPAPPIKQPPNNGAVMLCIAAFLAGLMMFPHLFLPLGQYAALVFFTYMALMLIGALCTGVCGLFKKKPRHA
jgi:hypothetical protein